MMKGNYRIILAIRPLSRFLGLLPFFFVGALFADEASLYDLRVNGSPASEACPFMSAGVPVSFSWKTQGGESNRVQTAVRVKVRQADTLIWDSGEWMTDQTTDIAYEGPKLSALTRYTWTAQTKEADGGWTAPATGAFVTGLLDSDDWAGAMWIASTGAPSLGVTGFETTFSIDRPVRTAYWSESALGAFVSQMDDQYISSRVKTNHYRRDCLKPGYTDRWHRLVYTYDVTDYLTLGSHKLTARVSPSWWKDEIIQRTPGPDPVAFCGRLWVEFEDGSTTNFVTHTKDWYAQENDPVTRASIYYGEDFDARLNEADNVLTNKIAVKAINKSVQIRPANGATVCSRSDLTFFTPVTWYVYSSVTGREETAEKVVRYGDVIRSRQQEKLWLGVSLHPNETLVLDFGQNHAGVPTFLFSAARGTVLSVQGAEMLNDAGGYVSRGCDGPGGSPYRANYRGIRAGLTYTFAGKSSESYQPEFTFFGYRYLVITTTAEVLLKKVFSTPLSSVLNEQETGYFESDHPILNRLWKNCVWGHYSNYLSVPTDCPQRNERWGWTADTQIFAPAACWNANVLPFLSKWLADVRASQQPDGALNAVVPQANFNGWSVEAGWTDAAVIVPWILYTRYGTRSVLRESWPCATNYLNKIWREGYSGGGFGDWLSPKGKDLDYVRAACRVRVFDIARRWALALDDSFAAARYADWTAEARQHFRTKFVDSTGAVRSPTQTRLLMALSWQLLSSDEVPRARAALKEAFAATTNRLDTGFLSTPLVLEVLADDPRDIARAYDVLLQPACPGWLYPIAQGATTMWERWDSYTKERGFGPAQMNSFNHYAYGAVEDWLYSGLAGIRPCEDKPGFKHFQLRPCLDPRLGACKATFLSPYGEIVSAWTCSPTGAWCWTFTVPVNTTADVWSPGASAARVYRPGRYTLEGQLAE